MSFNENNKQMDLKSSIEKLNRQSPTFVDLCCGVGGSTIAAVLMGFRPMFVVEENLEIGTIHLDNFAAPLFPLRLEEMQYGSAKEKVNWLHASPGRAETTSTAVSHAVSVLQPDIVTIELLSGMTAMPFIDLLKFGYWGLSIDRSPTDVGIPQSRKRGFLLLTKQEVPHPGESVGAALPWTSVLREGEADSWATGKIYRGFEETLTILSPGLQFPILTYGAGRFGKWEFFEANSPAGAILASQFKRRTSVVLESGEIKDVPFYFLAGRLMGFPSDFVWGKSKELNYTGLGNAVVPAVLRSIVEPAARQFGLI